MTPQQFCQLAMSDYERQWAAAVGHQERHPLRVKMMALQELMEREYDAESFTKLLRDSCDSDDPHRVLLCSELGPWWERVRSAPVAD